MFLSGNNIRELMKNTAHPLIEPLPDEERLNSIEGGAYDISVESVHAQVSVNVPMIMRQSRTLPVYESLDFDLCIAEDQDTDHYCRLRPADYYLIQSYETINLPANIGALVRPRTSFFRAGVILSTGIAHPGYSGKIVVGAYVPASCTGLKLGFRARFCSLLFYRFSEPLGQESYTGIWSVDRVSTDGLVERPH